MATKNCPIAISLAIIDIIGRRARGGRSPAGFRARLDWRQRGKEPEEDYGPTKALPRLREFTRRTEADRMFGIVDRRRNLANLENLYHIDPDSSTHNYYTNNQPLLRNKPERETSKDFAGRSRRCSMTAR